jgi:ring-1,2-phenylacetyl-CoA epoxidase subunit PaaB
MTIVSLDPRVTRLEISSDTAFTPLEPLDQHPTYEVFHQERRGEHHVHVGSLHAPNDEIALILAKEQYGRRSRTVSIWVVPTAAIRTISVEDADIFETTPEKDYREAKGYRVGTKLKAWKRGDNSKFKIQNSKLSRFSPLFLHF